MRGVPSTTAEAVCLMRASDRRRRAEERIIDDPYAALFLSPISRAALATFEATGRLGERAEEQLSLGVTTYVLARHRFIDDCLASALQSGTAEQVVLLGAGYDTRAYRFADQLGTRPVFELDHPLTSKRKAELVEAHRDQLPGEVDVRRIGIDFQEESFADRLTDAGFRLGAPSFFVWEGVSMYLTRQAVKATLRAICGVSSSASHLAMDFWFLLDAPGILTTAHRAAPNLFHFLGEPITFGIHPEDVGSFLEREGLVLEKLRLAEELEADYVHDGRRVYPANYVVHARTA